MDTTAIADRVHFAALIMFHYLFPPVTIGLGILIATLKVMQLRRGEGYDGLHARAARFWGRLFLLILPLTVLASLVVLFLSLQRTEDGRAVTAGAIFLAALMGSAGAGLYPLMLLTLGQTGQGLSIFNAASPRHTLETALAVNVMMMGIVIAYNIYIYRVFRGTVQAGLGEHGY